MVRNFFLVGTAVLIIMGILAGCGENPVQVQESVNSGQPWVLDYDRYPDEALLWPDTVGGGIIIAVPEFARIEGWTDTGPVEIIRWRDLKEDRFIDLVIVSDRAADIVAVKVAFFWRYNREAVFPISYEKKLPGEQLYSLPLDEIAQGTGGKMIGARIRIVL